MNEAMTINADETGKVGGRAIEPEQAVNVEPIGVTTRGGEPQEEKPFESAAVQKPKIVMHGNVSEWCSERYDAYEGAATDPQGPALGLLLVYRGGGWINVAWCRSAWRGRLEPGHRYDLGLRLVCSAGPRR